MSARKERARKWLRCKVDPEYFIRNFVKIVHQKKGIIPFDMYDFQERALKDLFEYDYNIILKARQMGLTTLLSAYALWLMIFENNKEVLALSYKQNKARNIIKKIKRMNSHLPSWMKERKVIDNQLEVEFENGSKAHAESTTSDAGRSESASFVIIDEAAFIDGAAEVWSAVKLTLDVGGGTCAVLSCVTDDTYVFTNQGLTQVSEIAESLEEEGNYAIPGGYSVLGKNKIRKGRFFKHNGTAKTKIVETKFGSVQGTPNHKLYTQSNGYKKLKNISEDDWVAIQYGMEVFGGDNSLESSEFDKIDEDLAYLFGLYLSEHKDLLSKLNSKKEKEITSKHLHNLFEEAGLKKEQEEKEISPKLLKMSKKNIVALIQGIFDENGWSKETVGVISTSEKLIDQVRLLLQNLGILSWKERRPKVNKQFEYGRSQDSFVLELSEKNSRKFHKKIGFGDEEKQKECKIEEDNKTQKNNIKWAKVQGVEDGEEKETYDFALPDREKDDWAHSVTYNGIIGHQTPTGVGTWFHETWQKAIQGKDVKKIKNSPEIWKGSGRNDFHPIKLHWSLHPERDQEWREEQTRTMGEKKAAREADCDFSTSGDTVIDQQIIQWYDAVATKDPAETHRRGQGDVWIWNQPEPGNTYIMASDVARGDGDDFSTFQIYEATKMEQVAEYKGKMPPAEFGNLLYTYGSMFNDALLVIERDSYGWTAMQRVIDRNYPNLLYTSNDLKLVEIDRDKAFGKDKKMNPGLDTNRNTRGLIISTLQRFMRKKWIHCKSSRFTEELQTFIWKNKGTRQKPEHMDGYNDDLVFAAAFACWARDKALKYRAEMGQRSQESLDNIKGSQRIYSGKQSTMDPYVQDLGGHKEDMRWLLE